MEHTVHREEPIIAVGGLIYRRRGRQLEILLIKKRGGFWTLPKGQVEPGETQTDAVAREICEETGLHGKVGPCIRQISYTIMKRQKLRSKVVTYYLFQPTTRKLCASKKERIEKMRWFHAPVALRRIKRGKIQKVATYGIKLLDSLVNPVERHMERSL